jgi:hypothetical protein
MSYIPKLFIGIGETNAFFTLRESYQHFVPGPGDMGNAVLNGVYQGTIEIRSFHHFNLSQNADEAFAKAKDYADKVGLPLMGSVEELTEQMREIKRATAEEMAARVAADKARQAEWDAQRARWNEELIEVAKAGFCVIGKQYYHEPVAYEKVDVGYINWLMAKRDSFEEGSLTRITADTLIANYPELKLPTGNGKHPPIEPGTRAEFEAKAVAVFSFDTEFGTCFVNKLIDKGGYLLVAMTGAFKAEVGETYKFKATVKELGEFNGEKQTKIQRIAMLDEAQARKTKRKPAARYASKGW